MSSLLFYVLVVAIVAATGWLFYYQRRNKQGNVVSNRPLVTNFNPPEFTLVDKTNKPDQQEALVSKPLDLGKEGKEKNHATTSPYDPKLIVLQVNAFPGKPYMGYELHQALLTAGMRLGENNIFHRYENEAKGEGKILFSLAAATRDGSFAVEDIGAFKCNGLLLFMNLDTKYQLMTSFNLMLDTARQLAEELGGEIYDDLHHLINADVIKRVREKICTVETSNLYVSDLLDNLD